MIDTVDEFVADLRRLISRWEGDLAKLEAIDEQKLADQVRAWIAEAEGIIAARGSINTQ